MRLGSFFVATLVVIALYFWVMERPMILALAGIPPAAGAVEADAKAAQTAAREPSAEPRLRVVVEDFFAQELEKLIVLRGRTVADRRVEVRAETQGTVISPPRRRGERVEEGDVLCALDPGTRAAALAEAEARLAEARINYQAALGLAEGGFAAQTRVAAAAAAVRSAEAAVARAQVELERLTIRSPFTGVLETDTAEQGSFLSVGGLCAVVAALDPIRLVGQASELQIDEIVEGGLAGGRLSSGREVLGRVTVVARTADPATRTFRVEVSVPNPDLSIRDGMSVDILIQGRPTRAHLIPASALVLDDTGALGVRVVDDDGVVGFAPVRVIRDTPEGYWVSGLPDRSTIIVVGQAFVTAGARVEPMRRAQAQE